MVNIKETSFGRVSVIQRSDRKWGVVDSNGKEIVSFGKYDWIDGFDNGLCRVRGYGKTMYTKNIVASLDLDTNEIITDKAVIERNAKEDFRLHPDQYAKWGIINEAGEEVLPVEYDEIWNFYGKNRFSTKVVKNGETTEVYFHELNPSLPVRHPKTIIVDDIDDVDDTSKDYFDIDDCYDYEGNFDYDRLEDAIMDGEYVPEEW